MLRISNLSLPLDYTSGDLKHALVRQLRVHPDSILSFTVSKQSVDARNKQDVHFVISADVQLANEKSLAHKYPQANAYQAPSVPQVRLPQRPIVIGTGPAGLFASLILAKAGTCPVILERGEDIDTRAKTVQKMTDSGLLSPESNIQFGEGGAGTFSDGKLTTGIKSPWQSFVLHTFCENGAPDSILIDPKPHIGTDVLRTVIKNMRESIIRDGGEFHFSSRMDSILIRDHTVYGIRFSSPDGAGIIESDSVFLCTGHSSRDTVATLFAQGVPMVQKPFAMGVRIEHLQEKINIAQYGSFASHPKLSPASYKLNIATPDGRGVYSFCMCPGGYVMAASSEPEHLCVNGMSYMKRDGINANSALLVGVPVSDFPSEHPLSGIELQRSLEHAAYQAGGGGYVAPVQRVDDFLHRRTSTHFGDVLPSYRPGTKLADLHDILPSHFADNLMYALPRMDAMLHGFADPDALMTGVEARSSSPVRIPRDQNGASVGVQGLYPCGEGAGYAGGIMSAAVDGINQAFRLIERIKQ